MTSSLTVNCSCWTLSTSTIKMLEKGRGWSSGLRSVSEIWQEQQSENYSKLQILLLPSLMNCRLEGGASKALGFWNTPTGIRTKDNNVNSLRSLWWQHQGWTLVNWRQSYGHPLVIVGGPGSRRLAFLVWSHRRAIVAHTAEKVHSATIHRF